MSASAFRDASLASDSDEFENVTVAMFQAPTAIMRPETVTQALETIAPSRGKDLEGQNADSETVSGKSKMIFAGLHIPQIQNQDDYVSFEENKTVKRIIRETEKSDIVEFEVKFEDYHTERLSYEALIGLRNGRNALQLFLENPEANQSESESDEAPNRARFGARYLPSGFVDPTTIQISSSEDDISEDALSFRQKRSSARNLRSDDSTGDRRSDMSNSGPGKSESKRFGGASTLTRSSARVRSLRTLRSKDKELTRLDLEENQSTTDNESFPDLSSDIFPHSRKRKRRQRRITQVSVDRYHEGIKFDQPRRRSERRSTRVNRDQNSMEEVGLGDVYRSDSDRDLPAPKIAWAKEDFQPLPRSNPFHLRHSQQCDTCSSYGSNARGQLIHCQGCSLSYHKSCMGVRSTRDHLVTKIGEANYVLQCRRCIGLAKKKDESAPDQGICQVCRKPGEACRPFRAKKTPLQEEKEREENGGEDPIVHVDELRLNSAQTLLFRCMSCWRGFHYHHLPPRDEMINLEPEADEDIAAKRVQEYCRDWLCKECKECDNSASKIAGLVAWRPIDAETYTPGSYTVHVNDDDKEYLVKWESFSYFQCQWMPGAWTWGMTPHMMRSAFAKRNNSRNLPSMRTEDAIPEEFLRVDIVLDVRFTSKVETRVEEVDKARIREVDKALMKYKGLGYEDAVWEKPPGPEDAERWSDFVTAYDDWVMGRYIKVPKPLPLKVRLEKIRSAEFSSLQKKKQPDNLTGGELMKYQLEGVNWLYYRWYQLQNAILADEMGLGKTVQIIGLLATLSEDHNCFPFLIVVPNSTCPNWRRELKKWAPSLRVVTYFGSSISRTKAFQYEMYPEGSKELRCHIVVTSYEAAADESCRKFFKNVFWQGLIVDEGQRLKNDKNMLYNSLNALHIPFRVLLTGTPLQNNARELFNLLQFLDDGFDAAALELEYEELSNENIPRLHNLVRPFFLRRTKAQVLTFLPPMAQIIVPVSMSILQRRLYSSILSKNPDLLKAIFKLGQNVKHSDGPTLNNILMQLRKCLCHPFVYSKSIEDRDLAAAASHRNLVDASPKLQLLEILLPKLRERGHRVLIFSQFLEMLDIIEDFLDGLELRYQRLDGTITSLQKQKRIDEFNAPNSPIFAFLLSTRAGGVGINLASADTVIILDPDFNPHRDIQALSRAHRIGQKNKVLCYQLMTRGSAEEKIVQIGRKKMAQTHILIERMDADEDSSIDMESILRYGAAEILKGGDFQDSRYDEASVEKLLDRSQIESTKAGDDNSAESQFSFARVWENDAGSLMDSLGSSEEDEKAPDATVWEQILQERERMAAKEAAARHQTLGRGHRARQIVDYSKAITLSNPGDADSDTDFQGDEAEEDSENETIEPDEPEVERAPKVQDNHEEQRRIYSYHSNNSNIQVPVLGSQKTPSPKFHRTEVIWPEDLRQYPIDHQQTFASTTEAPVIACIACSSMHQPGYCPLKLAGPEYCNLCGLAHYGIPGRVCPHIRSETQVRQMLVALKDSPEPRHLKDLATKYLRGVKGTIVQAKKAKALAANVSVGHPSDKPMPPPDGEILTGISDHSPHSVLLSASISSTLRENRD